jgi:hypothetical protein
MEGMQSLRSADTALADFNHELDTRFGPADALRVSRTRAAGRPHTHKSPSRKIRGVINTPLSAKRETLELVIHPCLRNSILSKSLLGSWLRGLSCRRNREGDAF